MAVTDARGATTLFGYDAASQLVTVTNALGEVTRLEYDANGNRTAIRNAAGYAQDAERAQVVQPNGDRDGRLGDRLCELGRLQRGVELQTHNRQQQGHRRRDQHGRRT